jgi:hypothetical protein
VCARIDPQVRWRRHGDKPDYAGPLTFAGWPYTEDPAELEGVNVDVLESALLSRGGTGASGPGGCTFGPARLLPADRPRGEPGRRGGRHRMSPWSKELA